MSTIFTNKIKNNQGGNNVRVNQLSGIDTAGSITIQGEGTATTNLQQGLLKAWSHVLVHTTLGDSFNIASVTDQGGGQSNDTFTNPFANTTYCINYGIRDGGGTNDDRLVMSGSSELFSTSQYGVYCVSTTTLNDADFLFLQYAGDLA